MSVVAAVLISLLSQDKAKIVVEYDEVPEQAFVAVGGIVDVLAKAERLQG